MKDASFIHSGSGDLQGRFNLRAVLKVGVTNLAGVEGNPSGWTGSRAAALRRRGYYGKLPVSNVTE